VIYIDDDEALVFLMKSLLEKQGYRASGFTDPREAVDAIRANPQQAELVVTDHNMPHLSGLDVARELRAIRADLPVALVSGYLTEGLVEQARGVGIREVLLKPDTVNELGAMVQRLLGAPVQ